MAATALEGQPGRLALLVDEATSKRFLVDSGSAYSILPFRSASKPCGPALATAGKTPIRCWGSRMAVVAAGGRKFCCCLLLADVAFPILGADFLQQHKLMIDLAHMQLVPESGPAIKLAAPPGGPWAAAIGVVAAGCPPVRASHSGGTFVRASHSGGTFALPTVEALGDKPTPGTQEPPAVTAAGVATPGTQEPPAVNAASVQDEVEELMAAYPGVSAKGGKLPRVKHNVQHVIETTCGQPLKSRYRRLDPEKLAAAKAEFKAMEEQGIIQRSNSSWASPLHMVKKKDGTWRPCGDYRRLNLVTKADLYPPPHMEDVTAKLAGMKVFSKIDLRKGYWQIPVAARDIKKTAVITPFGLFEFKRMPFGLKNAGQTFQRMMDSLLQGLPWCFVYLDDVLVASPTKAAHKRDLKEVMARLESQGLVINEEKCQFYQRQVEFLGHLVDSTGIRPLPDKVVAITKFPKPATCSQLMSFLGMVNFYRRFIR